MRFAIKSALVTGLVLSLGAIPVSADFDRKKLWQDGEDYIVALHDAYIAAEKRLNKTSKYPDLPKFFHDRVIEVEEGAEVFPAALSDYPVADSLMSERLEWAYEETYDLTTSEAADMQPYLVADIQVSYEEWLVTMHINPKDSHREQLADAFETSLDALSNARAVVSASASSFPISIGALAY